MGKAGGAIAAFLVIWSLGVRHALTADDLELRERMVLSAERGPLAVGPAGAEPMDGGDVECYDLVRRPRRSVALVRAGSAR